jgi:MFS family permease
MNMANRTGERIFYGWWIVVAAFLNLFFVVGIVFYGFPVFYPALVESLHFTRAQVTQGFLLGFICAGLPAGLLAGTLIDRIGARVVILAGVGLAGGALVLMGRVSNLWQYEVLCILEIIGYVLAGPIANQVLIARWFRMRRGRAMGYAYLGLGLGGVVSPGLVNSLMQRFGWRNAFEIVGLLILIVLLPVGIWMTRSQPEDIGLLPDGRAEAQLSEESVGAAAQTNGIEAAVRTPNFWLIVTASTLGIGAIGAVIQHFIFFLKDEGYSPSAASRFMQILLASSLCGRVLVGYVADRFRKKNTMALFYFLLGASILLLRAARDPRAIWLFVLIFGFAMGADYMLIPLVTAESFGTAYLGKLLALIIMLYSLGQWGAPWIAGKIFDASHSYGLAWKIMAAAGMLGGAAIYAVRVAPTKHATAQQERVSVNS